MNGTPSNLVSTRPTSSGVSTTGSRLGRLGPHHAFEETEWLLKNRAVEEEEGAEGLILRRGRHVALYGQVCQEGVDLCYAHVERMALVVKEHEAASPADVGLASIR